MKTGKVINSFSGEYRFLSNFYPALLVYLGFGFATSEHAYQAMKMRDRVDFARIAIVSTPGKAKRLARNLPMSIDWDNNKVRIMKQILKIKFARPELHKMLLATGDAHLEEGNNWGDQFWGTVDGVGENHLGKILMEIRSEIRNDD